MPLALAASINFSFAMEVCATPVVHAVTPTIFMVFSRFFSLQNLIQLFPGFHPVEPVFNILMHEFESEFGEQPDMNLAAILRDREQEDRPDRFSVH